MRVGFHVSISGGMEKMAWTASSIGCEAVQVFSRSPRGGKAKPLEEGDVAKAKAVLAEHDIWPVVVHVPYFLNLASTDENNRAYSVDTLVLDFERAETLGAKYLVTHIGHKVKDEPAESPDVLARVQHSIEEALSRYDGPVRLLLENTAGMGQEVGAKFEALAALFHSLPKGRAGVCLDTAHAFAAGYDLRGEGGVREILTAFDSTIGLKNLYAMHLNDCKSELGAHLDRHEQIGLGKLGLETFRAIVSEKRLPDDLPGLLEVPVAKPGDDLRNVQAIKDLRASHAGH